MKKAIPNKIKFSSHQAYRLHKGDIAFWHPYVCKALSQHRIKYHDIALSAGFNSTYPVFLTEKYVIKFFGHRDNWQNIFNNECAAYQLLAQDARIRVPQMIAQGQLFDGPESTWPYIISTRMAGSSWLESDITSTQKLQLVEALGTQIQYIHALPVNETLNNDTDWQQLNIKAAAQQSVLPVHLTEQVDDFVKQLTPFDKVFVNGDIVAMHVFINNGRLSGIIDWGDAVITDRHYELGKLCLDIFPGDKKLLQVFLKASNWPIKNNFPAQALGMALYRQAVGLTQHHTFDVFYQLPDRFNLNQVKSLDDLAGLLFDY
jgi:hygromycin-B 7''-O-kinase